MLELKIEVEAIEREIHEFELGHMIFSDQSIEISSKNKSPGQAMMIFLSVSSLLFSIQSLFTSEDQKKAIFSGDDSSFSLTFKKINGEEVEIWGHDSIIRASKIELVEAVWKAVNQLYDKYALVLTGSGAAKEDWDRSMAQFKNSFML